MKNKYELCPKCKATNIDSLINKIKKIDKNAEFVIRCIGFCGIGREKIVIILNHIPVIGITENEVINMIKERI